MTFENAQRVQALLQEAFDLMAYDYRKATSQQELDSVMQYVNGSMVEPEGETPTECLKDSLMQLSDLINGLQLTDSDFGELPA